MKHLAKLLVPLLLLLATGCGDGGGEASSPEPEAGQVNQVGAGPSQPGVPGGTTVNDVGVRPSTPTALPSVFTLPEDAPEEATRVADDGTDVELFYGTNRARQDYDGKHLWGPYLLPAVLAVLFLVTFLVRRSRRAGQEVEAARRSRTRRLVMLPVRAVLVVAVVALLLDAVQTSNMRRQRHEHLDVYYGADRSPGAGVELGTCVVSIPPVHEPGQLEEPSLFQLDLRLDPERHFWLEEVAPLEDAAFYRRLDARLAAAPTRSLFVFVHGFNNSFEYAAFRTAQIHHDLGFEGAPVFFSWPSQGAFAAYTVDENNVGDAVGDLEEFLDDLVRHADADHIHLVAHSMGSRALTRAVKTLGLKYAGQQVFDELVLAAPDLDAGEFEQLAKYLVDATGRITLYASSKDPAMDVSREFHGGQHPRAGESEPRPVTVTGVDTIDVSEVSWGHSYIADSGRILGDLGGILQAGRELDETIAEKVEDEDGVYWVLGGEE